MYTVKCAKCSVVADKNSRKDLSDYVQKNHQIINFSTSENWIILSPIEHRIKEKIEKYGTPLKDWGIEINRGILTGFNEAFIISGTKKDELIAKYPKSAEIIKPILRGKDIKKNSYKFANLWLICTFPSKKIDIDDYPTIRDHLLSFGKERLEQTGKKYMMDGQKIKSRKKTSNRWVETQDSISYWNEFHKPKIVFPTIMTKDAFLLMMTNSMLWLHPETY